MNVASTVAKALESWHCDLAMNGGVRVNECGILWCGKYHQNWENDLHSHNYFQMVGILSGSGTVWVDDVPSEISKEQVYLFFPLVEHAILCGKVLRKGWSRMKWRS